MKNRSFAVLFVCNIIPLFVGMGLFPLLPLYAAQFGASRTIVGIYYAITYAASVAGIVLTGWLGERMPRNVLFVAGGALGVPALLLLARATALWQVVLLTAAIWFSGAVTITLVSVYTALLADGSRRGASFSLMTMANPLGALLGGGAVGQLVTWGGYGVMFVVLAAVWAVLPLIGLLALHRLPVAVPDRKAAADSAAPALGRAFYVLLLACLCSATAINVSRLGTSLSMQALGFSAGAVASTAIVGGLVAAPLTLLIGALADRLGHLRFLLGGYGLALGGALLLLRATQLWHFWVAATLVLVAWCITTSIGSAMASSILPPAALGRGLPRLSATDSLASILGFAGTGYILDALGTPGLYAIAAGLAVLAALVLYATQRSVGAAAPAVRAPAPRFEPLLEHDA